jgi:hypothetical protein
MNKLPDIIKDCTTGISTTPRPVYFLFGNWSDLLIDLSEKKKSPTYQNLRFPLIFLHNDYLETIQGGSLTKAVVDETKIYIICQSSITGLNNPETYTTQQRWDSIYKLILEPILDDLLKQMKFGAVFVKTVYKIEYTRKDLYKLWVGNNKENKLPDNLDAIELTFRNLTYYLKN